MINENYITVNFLLIYTVCFQLLNLFIQEILLILHY